jgi:hypothetical protein
LAQLRRPPNTIATSKLELSQIVAVITRTYGALSSRRALQSLLHLADRHSNAANELASIFGNTRLLGLRGNLEVHAGTLARPREHIFLEEAAAAEPRSAVDAAALLLSVELFTRGHGVRHGRPDVPTLQELRANLRTAIRAHPVLIPMGDLPATGVPAEQIIDATLRATGVPSDAWAIRRPQSHLRMTRNSALYLASQLTALTPTDIAYWGRPMSRTAVIAAIRAFQSALNTADPLAGDTLAATLLLLETKYCGALEAAGPSAQEEVRRAIMRHVTEAPVLRAAAFKRSR